VFSSCWIIYPSSFINAKTSLPLLWRQTFYDVFGEGTAALKAAFSFLFILYPFSGRYASISSRKNGLTTQFIYGFSKYCCRVAHIVPGPKTGQKLTTGLQKWQFCFTIISTKAFYPF